MKKIFWLSLVVIGFTAACNFDIEEPIPDPDPPDVPSLCDSITVSYSNDVVPILTQNCYVCHKTDPPSGNVKLNVYDGVVVIVENEKLMKSIRHETGAVAMPRSSPKLDDSLITVIDCWINQGYPNN